MIDWRALCPEARGELESLFDPRFLDHRPRDPVSVMELRASSNVSEVRAVEIGSNSGEFLQGLSRRFPDARVLGIETDGTQHRLALDLVVRKALRNVDLLRCDARFAVPTLLRPESLDEVHVHFPDPWWKSRHHDRRLLEPLFLRVLARRLRVGGRLYVKSDVFDDLMRLRAAAEASLAFEPLPPELWPDEGSWTLTRRERKCMRVALPFGRGYYRRRASFDVSLPVVREDRALFEPAEEVDAAQALRGRPLADRIDQLRSAAALARRATGSSG